KHDRAREDDPVAAVAVRTVQPVDQRSPKKRNDRLRQCQRDVEQAHVLGRLLGIGQRVAGQRPIDCEVEAVADSVRNPQRENKRDRVGYKGEKHIPNKALAPPGKKTKNLRRGKGADRQPPKKPNGMAVTTTTRSQLSVKVAGLVVDGSTTSRKKFTRK